MFIPKLVLYEKDVLNYELGKKLIEDYEKRGVELRIIENHNNILEMRSKQNVEFPNMKKNIIIGIRKTHKFVPNYKTSDFLVPYTSSRLYCYVFVLLFSV